MKTTGLIILLSLFFSYSGAQETIDASDSSTYQMGGDQDCETMRITILPIWLVDIEPDPYLPHYGDGVREAGLEFINGVVVQSGEYWLNYTFRNDSKKKIKVRTSQKPPNDIKIFVEVIGIASNGGNFIPNPKTGQIEIDDGNSDIIDDFVNGYTGDGEGTGYLIRYTIQNTGIETLPPDFEIIYEIR